MPPSSQPPPPSYQPPPGVGGGYGPPPTLPPGASAGDKFSVGDAFNYGWAKFQANVGAIILGVLAYIAVSVVISIIWFFITGAIVSSDPDGSGGGFVGVLLISALYGLVGTLLLYVIQAGVIRAALGITYGRAPEVKTLLSTDQLGPVILGSLLVAVMTSIGFFFCFVPGLIVAFFTQFFMFFIIDKKMSPIDAIKASFSFVNKHLATLITFYIASLIAFAIGALLCGIGFIVAFPVVVIAQAYAYRKLQGETVAA